MVRRTILAALVVLSVLFVLLAALLSAWWWIAAAILLALLLLGIWDVLQRHHSVLRNYPVLGHLRYMLEKIRPEVQQYFIERNVDGRPFDRDTRSLIYERAKGIAGEKAFGTERDVNEIGYEYLIHSTTPIRQPSEPARVRIGNDQCGPGHDDGDRLHSISAMPHQPLPGRCHHPRPQARRRTQCRRQKPAGWHGSRTLLSTKPCA